MKSGSQRGPNRLRKRSIEWCCAETASVLRTLRGTGLGLATRTFERHRRLPEVLVYLVGASGPRRLQLIVTKYRFDFVTTNEAFVIEDLSSRTDADRDSA